MSQKRRPNSASNAQRPHTSHSSYSNASTKLEGKEKYVGSKNTYSRGVRCGDHWIEDYVGGQYGWNRDTHIDGGSRAASGNAKNTSSCFDWVNPIRPLHPESPSAPIQSSARSQTPQPSRPHRQPISNVFSHLPETKPITKSSAQQAMAAYEPNSDRGSSRHAPAFSTEHVKVNRTASTVFAGIGDDRPRYNRSNGAFNANLPTSRS
eukprot:TRINITY_DN10856_c0_g1_i1.p1 TRINITY_DN10856_c0_g1~~TRINITY_DN10856_c0_g1_i1.p1  ORF type:complete len:207 (+),score=34.50 TRINITY_DN10856_c0_g1_i1:126-746(+)